jgi:hypothetical protein
VDEDGVRAGRAVRVGAFERLGHGVPGDERLHPGHHHEARVGLGVLAGGDLAAELADGRQLVGVADEGVHLRELLVLDAHAGRTGPLGLAGEAAGGVEVAVAGVAVDEYRQVGAGRDGLHDGQQLRPRRLVTVAYAQRGRHAQAGRPQAVEPLGGGDARAESIVDTHELGRAGAAEQVA